MLMKAYDEIKKVLSKKIDLSKLKIGSGDLGASDLLNELPIRRITGAILLIMLAALVISASDPVKPGKEVETPLVVSLLVGGWLLATILNNLSMILDHKSFLLDILSVALLVLAFLALAAVPASNASGAEYTGFTDLVGAIWIFGNVIASAIDAIIIHNEQ